IPRFDRFKRSGPKRKDFRRNQPITSPSRPGALASTTRLPRPSSKGKTIVRAREERTSHPRRNDLGCHSRARYSLWDDSPSLRQREQGELAMTDPLPDPSLLAARFEAALIYALHVHGGQTRKKTSNPYISHLLSVAGLVLEQEGADEDLAIAALLHDAVEDQGGKERLADIRSRFGDRAAAIVRSCGNSETSSRAEKEP